MKQNLILKNKIKSRIYNSKDNTFLINDFTDIADRKQIYRILSDLVKKEEIIRVGKGIYIKVRRSSIMGRIVPKDTLREIAIEALTKLGIHIIPTLGGERYNNRLAEQVPNELIIGVDRPVSRQISFKKLKIKFEVINK